MFGRVNTRPQHDMILTCPHHNIVSLVCVYCLPLPSTLNHFALTPLPLPYLPPPMHTHTSLLSSYPFITPLPCHLHVTSWYPPLNPSCMTYLPSYIMLTHTDINPLLAHKSTMSWRAPKHLHRLPLIQWGAPGLVPYGTWDQHDSSHTRQTREGKYHHLMPVTLY